MTFYRPYSIRFASDLISCRFLGAARYVPLQDHSVRAVGRQVVRKLSRNKIKSVCGRRFIFLHSLRCEIINWLIDVFHKYFLVSQKSGRNVVRTVPHQQGCLH